VTGIESRSTGDSAGVSWQALAMKAVIVSYTVKSDFADKNAANIRAVMEEVRALENPGIRYQSFRTSENPSSFRHIGFYADEAAVEAMTALAAFKTFQSELRASGPVSPPKPEWLDLVGAGHDLF